MVFEAARLHFLGRQNIAPVEDQRPGHGVADAIPIELAELVPFGGDQQRFGILRGFVRRLRVFDLRQHGAGPLHGFRIVGADLARLPPSS